MKQFCGVGENTQSSPMEGIGSGHDKYQNIADAVQQILSAEDRQWSYWQARTLDDVVYTAAE